MSYAQTEPFRGLAAVWAAHDVPHEDVDFFQGIALKHQGRILDVGCGTGHLLRRLAAAGLEVEGVDVSPDPLEQCRRLAEADRLAVTLHQQPMQRLDLPGRYDTILVPCASFSRVMDRREALAALRGMREHLAAGGVLVANALLDVEPDLPEYPTDWQPVGTTPMADRMILTVDQRTMRVDRVDQTVVKQRRYRVVPADAWPAGLRTPPILAEEVRTGGHRWYAANELRWMAELAGLTLVDLTGDYTDEPLSPHHRRMVVLHAR